MILRIYQNRAFLFLNSKTLHRRNWDKNILQKTNSIPLRDLPRVKLDASATVALLVTSTRPRMKEHTFPGTLVVKSFVTQLLKFHFLMPFDVSLLSDGEHAGVRISWNHKYSIVFSVRQENMTTIWVLTKLNNSLLKDNECHVNCNNYCYQHFLGYNFCHGKNLFLTHNLYRSEI